MKFLIKMLFNQVCFAYASSAIDNDQFGAIGGKATVEFFTFLYATYKIGFVIFAVHTERKVTHLKRFYKIIMAVSSIYLS